MLSHAPSAFAGQGISSPYVTEGKHTIKADGYYTFDDNDSKDTIFRQRLSFDGGLTDKLGYRIRARFQRQPDESVDFREFELGGKYQLAEKGEWPIDLGLYSTLNFFDNRDAPSQLENRLLLGKAHGKWQHIYNIIYFQNFGEDTNGSPALDIRGKSLYKTLPELQLGYEYYGDFGRFNALTESNDKEHQLGPYAVYKVPDSSVTMEMTYLVGISSAAPDGLFKWGVKYGF